MSQSYIWCNRYAKNKIDIEVYNFFNEISNKYNLTSINGLFNAFEHNLKRTNLYEYGTKPSRDEYEKNTIPVGLKRLALKGENIEQGFKLEIYNGSQWTNNTQYSLDSEGNKLSKEQIKEVTNQKPTTDSDIRYDLGDEYEKVYHGSKKDLSKEQLLPGISGSRGSAIYVTKNLEQAKLYGYIQERYIDKNAKVFDFDKFDNFKIINDIENFFKKNNIEYIRDNNMIKSEKYGTIDFEYSKNKKRFNTFLSDLKKNNISQEKFFKDNAYGVAKFGEDESQIVIYNKDVLKTKEQIQELQNDKSSSIIKTEVIQDGRESRLEKHGLGRNNGSISIDAQQKIKESRNYTSISYKKFEQSIKPINENKLTTEQKQIKYNVKRLYHRDIVFFNDKNSDFIAGASLFDTNKIFIGVEASKYFGEDVIFGHELLETIILENKNIKEDLIIPTIDMIINDKSFNSTKNNFWKKEKSEIPPYYLIAKDILCDRFLFTNWEKY